MSTNRSGLILLIFLCLCHVIGILFFCKGFLLKRVVVPEYSRCSRTHTLPSEPLPSCSNFTRRYRRVVWLLIDALRYDFVQYDDSLQPAPVFRNKMTFVRDLLQDSPAHAKLFRFIADPPTTTMQRLKALTTGGLPTFIDISSNFNSYEILEDSVIYQAFLNGRNVTFMGDDTWLGLYPNMLTKVFDFPSLNVKDIHTVDNGVIKHLFKELELGDAELIIGHFLGVDHIGHTYGPSHWTMGDKLIQLDNILKLVVESVDSDTLVVVLGDHGMTSTGDHGGETSLETDAALLVYSKLPLFDPLQVLDRSVCQIDLVPTVSLLLGVPIPFSNLGMIIPELFLSFNGCSSTAHYEDGLSGCVTHELLTALRINAKQIHKYLVTYSKYSGDIPAQTHHTLSDTLHHTLALHDRVLNNEKMSGLDLTELANAYMAYMRGVRRMCQLIWAKFDDLHIWYGIVLTLLSALVTLFALCNVGAACYALRGCLYYCAPIGLVLAGVMMDGSVLWTGFMFVYWTLVLTSVATLWRMRCSVMLSSLCHPVPVVSSVALTIIGLYAGSFLSNSFILYEGDMLIFFLQTLIVCFAIIRLQVELIMARNVLWTFVKTASPCIALMVCLRGTKIFYSCRDLQFQDGCKDTTFISSLESIQDALGVFGKWRLLLSCVSVVAAPIVISQLTTVSNMSKFINKWSLGLLRFGLPAAGGCVAGYWSLQLLPTTVISELSYWEHVVLPWTVYALGMVTVISVVWKPLAVFPREIISEETSKQVRSPGASDGNLDSSTLVKVEQVEQVVGIVVIVVLTSVWVPLSMLLNDGLALSGVLTIIQLALSIKILSRVESSNSLLVCVFWGLLASHTFFSHGHTTTVTSLRFECAFTGIHGEITPLSLPLAGVLVGLNTLGSHILYGLGLPLLLLLDKLPAKNTLSDRFLRVGLIVICFHSVKLIASMFAASIHRRHLMVWWVFTPRFLYEAAFQVTTDVSIMLAYLLVWRVENAIRDYLLPIP